MTETRFSIPKLVTEMPITRVGMITPMWVMERHVQQERPTTKRYKWVGAVSLINKELEEITQRRRTGLDLLSLILRRKEFPDEQLNSGYIPSDLHDWVIFFGLLVIKRVDRSRADVLLSYDAWIMQQCIMWNEETKILIAARILLIWWPYPYERHFPGGSLEVTEPSRKSWNGERHDVVHIIHFRDLEVHSRVLLDWK